MPHVPDHFISRQLKDAVFCNARQRTIAMDDVWPAIEKSHERETKSRTLKLTAALVLISLLSCASSLREAAAIGAA